MSLLRETSPDSAARRDTGRRVYRSDAELKMRVAVEAWGRAKWPGARVCHELVMDRGTVRADVAFITADHLAVVEIKSENDDTTRLLHQCGMFRLAAPEVWIAAPARHIKDAEIIRWLMPSIGVALTDVDFSYGSMPNVTEFKLEEAHQPLAFQPYRAATLALLWVAELESEARRALLLHGSKTPTHARLIDLMMKLEWPDQLAAVCRQLRGRAAFWRADPPIPI